MNDLPDTGRRQYKIDLLYRIQDLLGFRQEETGRAALPASPLEQAMRTIIGVTFLGIGLVAVLPLGLPKIFSPDDVEVATALFLILGGMLAALTGAGLVRYYYGP